LINFAQGGEGSATAGLADDRRRAATVSGVIRAFDNDNPLAFAALTNANLLGENLTTDQQNAIKSSKNRFEQRRRQEYNAELMQSESQLMLDVENGRMEPMAAVEALSIMYAEHGITMNGQEAGAIYSGAEEGQAVAQSTRGALLDTAVAQGDLTQQADIIIDSLTVTESSGDAGAFRTNVDSRQFGGLIQMGQGRLDDYRNAVGGPKITPAQFSRMSKGEQREINRWHVRDLIVKANATGAIGSTINGVEVTLSGLVAVGHLGGAGGMQRFVRSGGQYNPSDELGTSLTDYLSKHGKANQEVLYSPRQRMQRAMDTRNQVFQRQAAEVEAQMQPERDADDALFERGIIDRGEWDRRNADRLTRYGAERTLGTVRHEADVLSGVATAAVASAVDDETRGNALQFELGLESAREEFESIAQAVSQGQQPTERLAEAQEAFFGRMRELSNETGVKLDANDVVRDVRTISQRDTEARDAARQHHQDGMVIAQAIASGTLGDAGISNELRQRAIRENEQQLIQLGADAVARGDIKQEEQAQFVMNEQQQFLAQSGVVDDRMRRVMNGHLTLGALDKDGNPRPEYVEAVEAYRNMAQQNPTLADKYIDPEHRGDIDAILHNAGDGPVIGAVRAVGVRKATPDQERDPAAFVQSARGQELVNGAMEAFLEENEIGFLHAIWQDDANLSQVFDMTSTDRQPIWSEDNTNLMREELRYELEQAYRLSPTARPGELMDAASRRVQQRTTVIAGEVVQLPRGQSFGEAFFGGNAVEFAGQDGVFNTALMDYLRTDEVREQHPFLTETTFAEGLPVWLPDFIRGEDTGTPTDQADTLLTGVRPFIPRIDPMSGQMYIEVSRPEGGHFDTIAIDPREVGTLFMQNHRRNLTQESADPFAAASPRAGSAMR